MRPEIAALAAPAELHEDRSGALRLLVIGGSLGAKVLNDVIPQGPGAVDRRRGAQIVHQAGEQHLEALKANYAAAGIHAHCVAFIDDGRRLRLGRSRHLPGGALTVAELAAAGVPAILVPFPHAVDDHQTGNARFLVNVGGAFPHAPRTNSARKRWPDAQLQPASCWKWRKRPGAWPNPTPPKVANICAEVAK